MDYLTIRMGKGREVELLLLVLFALIIHFLLKLCQNLLPDKHLKRKTTTKQKTLDPVYQETIEVFYMQVYSCLTV